MAIDFVVSLDLSVGFWMILGCRTTSGTKVTDKLEKLSDIWRPIMRSNRARYTVTENAVIQDKSCDEEC